MSGVRVISYDAPQISTREVMRYAGGADTEEMRMLLDSVLDEAEDVFSYKVCYTVCDVTVDADTVDLGFFKTESRALAKNLRGVKKAVVFAATVGFKIDRLIMKYTRTTPSRALIFSALGTERIEALCDEFSEDMRKKNGKCRPRFSAGYGDLSLDVQKEIFKFLDPAKKIGLALTDSMLMTPTKSVTAFIGIED